jgi:hypothetical protein
MARYTVREAADMLGITTGAVRNRLSPGTSPSTKDYGTVCVLLPADISRDAERDTGDTPPGMSQASPEPGNLALTSELRDRLRYVEGQLEAERQAHAEARRLVAAALECILAIISGGFGVLSGAILVLMLACAGGGGRAIHALALVWLLRIAYVGVGTKGVR